MPSSEFRTEVLRLYRAILRLSKQCSNSEHRTYMTNECKKQFKIHRSLTDGIAIRECIHKGNVRILTYEWYGDPWPRNYRDEMRVLRMGAGYTKKGRQHTKWQKREGRFLATDFRKSRQIGWNYLQKKRLDKFGNIPVYESNVETQNQDNTEDDSSKSEENK